jgi:hypothetical protein
MAGLGALSGNGVLLEASKNFLGAASILGAGARDTNAHTY